MWQGATMLAESSIGDLWMPLTVFTVLGVTLGIGLSKLFQCAPPPQRHDQPLKSPHHEPRGLTRARQCAFEDPQGTCLCHPHSVRSQCYRFAAYPPPPPSCAITVFVPSRCQ